MPHLPQKSTQPRRDAFIRDKWDGVDLSELCQLEDLPEHILSFPLGDIKDSTRGRRETPQTEFELECFCDALVRFVLPRYGGDGSLVAGDQVQAFTLSPLSAIRATVILMQSIFLFTGGIPRIRSAISTGPVRIWGKPILHEGVIRAQGVAPCRAGKIMKLLDCDAGTILLDEATYSAAKGTSEFRLSRAGGLRTLSGLERDGPQQVWQVNYDPLAIPPWVNDYVKMLRPRVLLSVYTRRC